MDVMDIYKLKSEREDSFENINKFARFFEQRMRHISTGGKLYNWQYASLMDAVSKLYGITEKRSVVEVKDRTVCFNIYVWDKQSKQGWRNGISLLRASVENSQKQIFPSLTVRLTEDDIICISVEFPEEKRTYQNQKLDCIGKRKEARKYASKYNK